ncbi:hypothetical protein FN846DRAFT_1012415 [Sphaerosporella brunnea]|uniref:Uncharacterized protein n=1 Tax=Sphaerosporella brunnea TaxID=1250544 RepID=A0A5J5EYN9_9PEZI|nr:hypothetical protein FN846DRAFT_1012415 [Sphaerosporella brunnea]
MSLAKLYAQYELPAHRTTDEETHTLIAEFICDNGWYSAYHPGKNGTVQHWEAKPGVGAVIEPNHLWDFGTSVVGLGMVKVRSRGIPDVSPSPLNLAVVVDLPLAQQQQQQQQDWQLGEDENWAAWKEWQLQQEARQQQHEDQPQALPGQIDDILDGQVQAIPATRPENADPDGVRGATHTVRVLGSVPHSDCVRTGIFLLLRTTLHHHINNMAATNDGFQLVVRRHRCQLCAGGHTTANCTVPIAWSLQQFESANIWRSNVQLVAVEVAIRAEQWGTHDSTSAAIGTGERCADFPHFNESVQLAGGRAQTAYIYHTPYNGQQGIGVVLATVGTCAANINTLTTAFAPHGIYLRNETDELLFSG